MERQKNVRRGKRILQNGENTGITRHITYELEVLRRVDKTEETLWKEILE